MLAPASDEDVASFVSSLEDYTPLIPDELAEFYLQKTGFSSADVRVKRLVALAAQKFIADVASDSLQYCKLRQQASKSKGKEKRLVLTMDDLTPALRSCGVTVRKPAYFADPASAQPAVKGPGE
eukprot:tig00022075_g23592.t1